MKRQSTLQKLNDNYFYKNFAANENEQEQIIEESDENSSEDEEEKAYKPRAGRGSERSARISNRSKSAQSHLKVTDGGGENYRSFSGMNQVGRLSQASRDDNELEDSKRSMMSRKSRGSDLADLTPE